MLLRSVVRQCLVAALLGLVASLACAAPDVRVGVLAFFGKADALKQWEPTASLLEKTLGDRAVHIEPLDYDELTTAVANRKLDFVFTNPEHFVVLRNAYGLSAVATLSARVGGQVVDRFGSVIFTRADANAIHTVADVRGRRVAAVGLYSLGGYLLAADVFRAAGIDLRSKDVDSLTFTGLPHPQVVERVMDDLADVGIVRTGVLEGMARQGRLDLTKIRVLNARPEAAFPQRLSSELAPEWPWASTQQADPALVKAVTVALLNISAESPAASAGKYEGFAPPANYAPVEDLMRRLHIFPKVGTGAMLRTLWLEYEEPIRIALGLLALVGLGLSVHLWRNNRRLRQLTELYAHARIELQTTAAAFDSQVGLLVTDSKTRILRANQAFTDILGYTESDLKGRTTALLRGSSIFRGRLAAVWERLQQDGSWSGELTCTHRRGQEVPCMVTITAIKVGDTDLKGFVGSFVDMSQHVRDQQAIRQLAYYDVLTGLPNRRQFLQQLGDEVASTRQNGQRGALVFIDLDHFKTLNDAHGHSVGDELLKAISQRLQQAVGPAGMVARLGGDEFVIMLSGLDSSETPALEHAIRTAERIREAILMPYQLTMPLDSCLKEANPAQTLSHRCSASIGVALFCGDTLPVLEIMKRADIAMYQAKQAGRNTIRHYDPQVQRLLDERAALAADLSTALAEDQLVLHYQAQVDRSGRTVAAECLLRWVHPTRGVVSPAQFIPVAEDTGHIVAIGDWVIDRACETLARWAASPDTAHLELSVNVSPRQFTEANFVTKLEQALARSGARPENLMLEITEGIVLENADAVADRMQRLCRLGVSLSIDDFGTGYSSLSYLQRLPLRQLKIDRSFIRDLDLNRNSEAIVRAIIALGISMGLTVVAEGVETEPQRELLVAMGCGMLQGFHLGRPVRLEDFERSALERLAAA